MLDWEKDVGVKFGQFVKAAREEKGLSQRELAELMDVTQTYISIVELGKRRVDLSFSRKICKVLNVDLRDFLNVLDPIE